jgi:hypothetical protein
MDFVNLPKPKLKQMLRFEPAPGPSITLLEFNAYKILCCVEFAVYDLGFTMICGKIE